jgi:hypothetical protein
VGIGDVAPVRNLVDAAAILADHGVADVGKLAVLKNEEVVALRDGLQLLRDAVIPPSQHTQHTP